MFNGIIFSPSSITPPYSNHALRVAKNYYSPSSLLPIIAYVPVDLYHADDWLNTDFLRTATTSLPAVENRAVQNHSWIISFGWTPSQIEEANMRLDYAIHNQGFVCVVGENNGASIRLPHFLGQSYHTISVGRDDGLHSAGLTDFDGVGRMKPDIVGPSAAPENATSFTTPMVASASALLSAKLSAAPYSLANVDRPRVIKALLLASATKDTLAGWDHTSTAPLDNIYGAGELNIHHAYQTLIAGKAISNNTQYGIRGWAAQTVNANSALTYYFAIPPGVPSTPFSSALIWHRNVTTNLTGGIKNGIRTWEATLANLNLRLYQADGINLGSLLSESISGVDNLELIYQSGLPPGNYALQVDNLSDVNVDYALAWHSLPAVTVAASISTAREIDGQSGLITFTRTGDTTLPLYVPLIFGGSAISGSHYQPLPSTITIPAGDSTATLAITPISDNIAQGPRTLSVAIAADFALVRDVTQPAIVTIEDKPFDAWRFTHFPNQLGNPAISSETADPDADELSNLIEYALNLSPTASSISPLNAVDVDGYLALSATKNPTATDIIWSAQVSSALNAWTDATPVLDDVTTYQARDTVLMSQQPKRFIRLKITRP